MNLSRRNFLGSSLVFLGGKLLEALTAALWEWRRALILHSERPNAAESSPVIFVDVAREAGLNAPNVWGATDHKKYIIEAKGSGIAFSTTIKTGGSIST